MRAVYCISDIERILNLAEAANFEVSFYRDFVPGWLSEIFHFPYSWQHDGQRFSNKPMLQALASQIDSWMSTSTSFTALEGKNDEIHEMVSSLQSHIAEDDSLSNQFRAHMQRLFAHVFECLDDEKAGIFNILDALNELSVYVDAASVRTASEEHRSFYENVSAFFRNPENSPYLVLGIEKLADFGMKALGQ